MAQKGGIIDVFQYIGMNRVQVFYKAGSGFKKAAAASAKALASSGGRASGWRFANPGEYADEIQKLFENMYRSGLVSVRDEKGRLQQLGGSDEALNKAGARIEALAQKMANDVEVYDKDAQEKYSQLQRVWGKAVRVDAKDMKEFRNRIQEGQKMLVNVRGTKGTATRNSMPGAKRSRSSDAAERAREAAQQGLYQTEKKTNVDILTEANDRMNAARSLIWRNARERGETQGYAYDFNTELWNRYERLERQAAKRRRK